MDNFKELVVNQVKALKPSFLSKNPHFNFISAHYFWIIGMSIIASVLIYGPGTSGNGSIAYIDALFFASGANTQAGLNTVDLNQLNTFQQVVIMLFAMISNPIAINSFVVFLRLYWFEKRFQHVVREARAKRGTLAKSRSKAKVDNAQAENGVNGRRITVMHSRGNGRITNDGILLGPVAEKHATGANASARGGINGRATMEELERSNTPLERRDSRRPEIKFADMVTRSDGLQGGAAKVPPNHTDAEHIAILQRQRNQSSEDILRIPGPRDVERGMLPEPVLDRMHDIELAPTQSQRPTSMDSAGPATTWATTTADSRPQAIKIEEPEKPSRMDDFEGNAKAFANTFSVFKLRKPRMFSSNKNTKVHHDEDEISARRLSQSKRRQTFDNLRGAFSRDKDEATPYLSWEPTLGRNSAFPDLSEEQREELGGIEYRSLKTLALVLAIYFWGYWILGIICLLPWIIRDAYFGSIVDAAGQGRAWWGIFTPNSAMMDLGLTLTPDSMNSFNTAVFPLLLMSLLIVIGNTGFPIMLRFMIWVFSILVPRGTGIYEELRFLLDHPRRCFTLLFPSAATWWLFWLLVALNGIDLIFFIVLDLGSGVVAELPVGVRILDGLFQAFSTRTAGFSCVNLAALHPGVQTSYLIMMYISVFPIAISIRRTNVYEEKSLGVWSSDDIDEATSRTDLEYVGSHLRRQLSFDLWFIFIGFFILTISEGTKLQYDPSFTMFGVLFEVVSAYGTVGLSLGYPGVNASLSSQFSTVGKLVIIAMMIRGRHRGLPYGLDRAVLLPSESLNAKETADANARLARRNSGISQVPTQRPRGRSMSTDRGNANVVTRFLHPGPPAAIEHFGHQLTRRATTNPRQDDEDADNPRLHARRVQTTSVFKSNGLL